MKRSPYLLLLVPAILLFASISCWKSSSSSHSTHPAGSGAPGSGAPPRQGRWYAGDTHSHSTHSDGVDDVSTCIRLAEYVGLDFYAITDHRTADAIFDPAFRSGALTLIPGEEWGGRGHAVALGISRKIPEIDYSLGAASLNTQVQAVVDDAHAQGGVVYPAHPCSFKNSWVWTAKRYDAMEIWNIFWLFPDVLPLTDRDLDKRLRKVGLAAIGEDASREIRSAVHAGSNGNFQALKLWEEYLNQGVHLAAMGGGDRHLVVLPGRPLTHIFAASRSVPDLLEGIRKGRTWISCNPHGPRVEFTADRDGDGLFETMIGDSIPLVPGGRRVEFRVRVTDARDGIVEIVKNGLTFTGFNIDKDDFTATVVDTPKHYAWYRVDVFEKIDTTVPQAGQFQMLGMLGFAAGSGASGGTSGCSHGSASGWNALVALAAPLGFQVILGGRYPTIELPEPYYRFLNASLYRFGYSRGAITSPIYVE
jgi:hypothetical protein